MTDNEKLIDDIRRVLSLIDLTSLGEADDEATVDALCDAAETAYGSVAAVCVWPRFVGQAVAHLSGSEIAVAAVANFPDGNDNALATANEAEHIVAAGATEVDVVFPWWSLLAGDDKVGSALVSATRQAVGNETVLKVILETGELGEPELIRRAGALALAGGADFLKTSTGKTARSATPEAVRVLLELVGEQRSGGVKASGGVRTTRQAVDYLLLADSVMGPRWASPATLRIGASSLLADIVATLDQLTMANGRHV